MARRIKSNDTSEKTVLKIAPPAIKLDDTLLKTESIIIAIAANTSANPTLTTGMQEKLLASGVDELIKYYAEEGVDFEALSCDQQYIAVQHYPSKRAAAVPEVSAPAPATVADTPAPVLVFANPARPIASIKSDLSDAEWDSSINAALKTVEPAVRSEPAPVVEKNAEEPKSSKQAKQRKAKVAVKQLRSAKTLPAIFVSGSSRPLKLAPLEHLKLIQKYGDNSLQAELAMALAPKTDR